MRMTSHLWVCLSISVCVYVFVCLSVCLCAGDSVIGSVGVWWSRSNC